MKKIMALSMAAIMVFTVAGCSSNKPAETTVAGAAVAETAAGSDTTAANTVAGRETSEAAFGKKHIINTDTTFAPSEFESEKGEMVGIDLDILQTIAQDQGFEYEVVPVRFSVAVTALETGERDGATAGISITDERVQKYDSPEPYYDFGAGMAVPVDPDITSYDQLKDQKAVTKIDTEGCIFVEFIAEQYSFEVTRCESSSDMYQAILAGEAVTCFEDYPVIDYEISRGLGLILPTPKERSSSCGFATLKNANPGLVEVFSKGLENTKASSRYDEILNICIAK